MNPGVTCGMAKNQLKIEKKGAAGKGKRKAVYSNARISPGRSTHLRDAATPNGTDVGTQRLRPTPNGNNEARQFMRQKGASAEEVKTQQEKDSQSVKNARKRAKRNKNADTLLGDPSLIAL